MSPNMQVEAPTLGVSLIKALNSMPPSLFTLCLTLTYPDNKYRGINFLVPILASSLDPMMS